MLRFDFENPVARLTGNEFLPKSGLTFAQQILEYFQSFGGKALSPWGEVLLDKKGIQNDKSIYNLEKRRLYLHETFLTEKIPEIAASSLVRGSSAASPQSRGSIAKILQRFLNTKLFLL